MGWMSSLLGGLLGSQVGSRLGGSRGRLLGAAAGAALGSARGRKRARKALGWLGGGRGVSTPLLLLGAAGAGWGLYELGRRRSGGPPEIRPGPRPALLPPPIPAPPGDRASVLCALRVLVAAARSDGDFSSAEKQLLRDHARAAGLESELEREWDQPRLLADVVRGAADLEERRALYALAFAILRCDERVDADERAFLVSLGAALGLEPEATDSIEQAAARGIDDQPEDDA